MAHDQENLLQLREILVAYIAVLDRLQELIVVCSGVRGDTDDLRRAVQETFDLNPIQADAVIALQIRRFTPNERQKLREELARLDLLLGSGA